MQSWQSPPNQPRFQPSQAKKESPLSPVCLQIVDASLVGILFIAPLFFGGRHQLGRFILIALVGIASTAWFTRQALLKKAHWYRTWANILALAAVLLVTLQLLPLPVQWLETLSPRNASLLTLWNHEVSSSYQLGTWQTLSLTPDATRVGLATLVAYVLLFITVVGRLQERSDIEHVMRLIGLTAILMGGFGILQYFTSNGLFFWFYEYPYTNTIRAAKGSFTTRNHFAHFIALGIGPLLSWIAIQSRSKNLKMDRIRSITSLSHLAKMISLHLGLGIGTLAILLSFSRGGAAALSVASIICVAIYFYRGLLTSVYLFGLSFLVLLIIGALSLSGYEQVASRLDDFTSGSIEQLDNKSGRRKIWAANIAATQEGSLFGSGVGSHREIYPIYLQESFPKEYTHAENGYLQIATENGKIGITLLALAIIIVGSWCLRALRNAQSTRELALAGALTASLVASLLHSIVDFVWFIPACMSLTILLGACVLRLAQLTQPQPEHKICTLSSKLLRFSSALAVTCTAAWAITVTIGPAAASLHWDSYQRSAIANKKQSYKQLTTSESQSQDIAEQEHSTKIMIFHLRKVLARNPQSARAHIRLAAKYLQLFNQRQSVSENRMSIDQIRDAALASSFANSRALQEWLKQAFGKNSHLLYQAHYHATRGLQLCPLQGEGYLFLANLCFLEGRSIQAIDANIHQSLQVRPYDGDVVFEVGRQYLLRGKVEEALKHWQSIYPHKGLHQLKIIRLLAGKIPAGSFIQLFEPDWQTLRFVWNHYQQTNNSVDCETLLTYAEAAAIKECPESSRKHAASIWHELAKMQTRLEHHEDAIICLQKGYRSNPSSYLIRRDLGRNLLKAKRYKQAKPHLRWCISRRPNDTALQKQLIQATKTRLPSIATKTSNSQYQ